MMRVQIRGKYYDLRFVRKLSKAVGHCDHPTTPSKQIRILKGQKKLDEIDTIIHEIIHAAMWDASEETVEEMARDITRILNQLGYLNVDGQKD